MPIPMNANVPAPAEIDKRLATIIPDGKREVIPQPAASNKRVNGVDVEVQPFVGASPNSKRSVEWVEVWDLDGPGEGIKVLGEARSGFGFRLAPNIKAVALPSGGLTEARKGQHHTEYRKQRLQNAGKPCVHHITGVRAEHLRGQLGSTRLLKEYYEFARQMLDPINVLALERDLQAAGAFGDIRIGHEDLQPDRLLRGIRNRINASRVEFLRTQLEKIYIEAEAEIIEYRENFAKHRRALAGDVDPDEWDATGLARVIELKTGQPPKTDDKEELALLLLT